MSVDLILEVKILQSLLNNYILKIKSDGLEPFLLTGGDKSSQSKDIERALKMLREMEE